MTRTAKAGAGLAGLGVLLAVVGLLLPVFHHPAAADQKQRKEVAAAVTDFAVAVNTYDSTQLADYVGRMRPMLTKSFDNTFTQTATLAFGQLKAQKYQSKDAQVIAVGVDNLDADSATALVAVNVIVTTRRNPAGVSAPSRFEVEVQKVRGNWKINKYQQVFRSTAQQTPRSK